MLDEQENDIAYLGDRVFQVSPRVHSLLAFQVFLAVLASLEVHVCRNHLSIATLTSNRMQSKQEYMRSFWTVKDCAMSEFS